MGNRVKIRNLFSKTISKSDFQKADVNGDGFLTADEYYKILKEHGVDCSYDEIMHIMQVADKDHDG